MCNYQTQYSWRYKKSIHHSHKNRFNYWWSHVNHLVGVRWNGFKGKSGLFWEYVRVLKGLNQSIFIRKCCNEKRMGGYYNCPLVSNNYD